jgi:putative membrane protein
MLWGLVTLYALLVLVNYWLAPHSVPTSVLVLVPVAFALIHGAARYGWGGILAFILICLVVSNIFENVSILTGFPFGHYHYTGGLGPKLFLVPLLIGPAYISTGYLAWVIGNVLVGDVRRGTGRFTLFATPFIAAFAMVAWDVCLDPTLSTILKFWIWQDGGGFFGVPLTNYLGWFLTVYIFFQLFALYARSRRPSKAEARQAAIAASREHYAQAVALYAIMGAAFVLQYLTGTSRTVVDATGATWQTGAIYETAAILSLFTMIFIAALSAVKLIQQPAPFASSERAPKSVIAEAAGG